jgi:hypothetical protein
MDKIKCFLYFANTGIFKKILSPCNAWAILLNYLYLILPPNVLACNFLIN